MTYRRARVAAKYPRCDRATKRQTASQLREHCARKRLFFNGLITISAGLGLRVGGPKGGAASAAPSTKKWSRYSDPLFHYFFTIRGNSGRRDLWQESPQSAKVSVTTVHRQLECDSHIHRSQSEEARCSASNRRCNTAEVQHGDDVLSCVDPP